MANGDRDELIARAHADVVRVGLQIINGVLPNVRMQDRLEALRILAGCGYGHVPDAVRVVWDDEHEQTKGREDQ